MRVLWVCNIMLPVIAQALSQEYSVREGWLSGILGRYLETENGAELSAADVTDSAASPGGRQQGAETAAALTLGIAFPVAPGREELSQRLQLGSYKKEVACYGFAEDLEHPERYDSAMEARFLQILEDFQPDLVHIFGTEFPHGYACAKVFHRPERTLVGLQGLCISCADNYMADLPENVQNSRTLRDILKKDSIRQQQEKFYQRAENEKKLLLSVGHVTGRTTFDKTISLEINPSLVYHTMNETMRLQFYSGCWEIEKTVPGEIFISQGDYPLKGFHYLLQAMQEILQNCPEAHIKVAGISVARRKRNKEQNQDFGIWKISAQADFEESPRRKSACAGKSFCGGDEAGIFVRADSCVSVCGGKFPEFRGRGAASWRARGGEQNRRNPGCGKRRRKWSVV